MSRNEREIMEEQKKQSGVESRRDYQNHGMLRLMLLKTFGIISYIG